jgi:hypothetical protein
MVVATVATSQANVGLRAMSDRSEIIRRLRIEIHALEKTFVGDNPLIELLRKQLAEHEACAVDERREHVFRRAAWDLSGSGASVDIGRDQTPTLKNVADAVIALGGHLDQKYVEVRAMREITECMNNGQLLSEVMDNAFSILETVVPYDRLGISLIDIDSAGNEWVRLDWVQAKYAELYVKPGHSAQLETSRLQESFFCHKPFFMNDLEFYVSQNPNSTTAALLLKVSVITVFGTEVWLN